MKAQLTNYRQSPRKVRLVADLIRGKSVVAAERALTFLPKKSSEAVLKLLNSAVANARTRGGSAENLFVKTIAVNKGLVMRRVMPKARGRAARYAKTMSIVTLELAQLAPKVEKPVRAKKTAKKAAKKKEESKSE